MTKHPVRVIQLPKNLTKTEALKAVAKKATSDYRAVKYDPKTGKAKVM